MSCFMFLAKIWHCLCGRWLDSLPYTKSPMCSQSLKAWFHSNVLIALRQAYPVSQPHLSRSLLNHMEISVDLSSNQADRPGRSRRDPCHNWHDLTLSKFAQIILLQHFSHSFPHIISATLQHTFQFAYLRSFYSTLMVLCHLYNISGVR